MASRSLTLLRLVVGWGNQVRFYNVETDEESKRLDKLQSELVALERRAQDVLPRVESYVELDDDLRIVWRRKMGAWRICAQTSDRSDPRNNQILIKLSAELRARAMKVLPKLFKAVLDSHHRRTVLVDAALGPALDEAWGELRKGE
jgi:hypothetical protein